MITIAIISAFITLFTWVFGFFPIISLPLSSFESAMQSLHGMINSIGFFVPLDTLAIVFTLLITLHIAVFTWKAFLFVFKKVTGR